MHAEARRGKCEAKEKLCLLHPPHRFAGVIVAFSLHGGRLHPLVRALQRQLRENELVAETAPTHVPQLAHAVEVGDIIGLRNLAGDGMLAHADARLEERVETVLRETVCPNSAHVCAVQLYTRGIVELYHQTAEHVAQFRSKRNTVGKRPVGCSLQPT